MKNTFRPRYMNHNPRLTAQPGKMVTIPGVSIDPENIVRQPFDVRSVVIASVAVAAILVALVGTLLGAW